MSLVAMPSFLPSTLADSAAQSSSSSLSLLLTSIDLPTCSLALYTSSKCICFLQTQGNGGIDYKESLKRFVKDLGPTAQKVANQKLKCLTWTPSHRVRGSSLQISSLATQQRPSCKERIINIVTSDANNPLGIHDASSGGKKFLTHKSRDINSNACRGQMVLGNNRLEIQDAVSEGKNVITGDNVDPYGDVATYKGENVVKGDGTNPYCGAY
ncbi:hypothetical protein TEA_008472 [Camellia sinensis var. sinensis]|uniref:Uncharacterized protein n=1 Tax=Camellia sinensis var. sinensis TaxID=542762 RepID=A0A4S4DUQ8_CAMSN|nr:hypothetical protein TEA_008472 [Camellia sinensis var. sinensis]